jgi:hypothetical protein
MKETKPKKDWGRLRYALMLLISLSLATYGLYCWVHMRAFIGTGHYWSNVWFYKSHACLFAMISLRLLTVKP